MLLNYSDCHMLIFNFFLSLFLQVNTDAESVKHLTFLGKILDPFIEAYWLSCVGLCQEEEGKDIQGEGCK